jgi:hypothetical protein
VEITAEKLAYWYLRLNGFLTTQNFVVHPDSGRDQRTDADILGIRFPYRAELSPNPMRDESLFATVKDKPYIVIAEVKKGRCKLNGPWTDPKLENLQRVLKAIGALPDSEIEPAAKDIYTKGIFSNKEYHVSLVCFGKRRNSTVSKALPEVPQILWDSVLKFIFSRFTAYERQKVSHGQWDEAGKSLWDCVFEHLALKDFKSAVTISQ